MALTALLETLYGIWLRPIYKQLFRPKAAETTGINAVRLMGWVCLRPHNTLGYGPPPVPGRVEYSRQENGTNLPTYVRQVEFEPKLPPFGGSWARGSLMQTFSLTYALSSREAKGTLVE